MVHIAVLWFRIAVLWFHIAVLWFHIAVLWFHLAVLLPVVVAACELNHPEAPHVCAPYLVDWSEAVVWVS